MTLDYDKYLETLQFLLRPDDAGGANNAFLGRVKLMKLLYFADFDHFYQYSESITGDSYIKREFGPVPVRGTEMINELIRAGRLDVSREKVYDYTRYKYELRGAPVPLEHLTWRELATLRKVVAKWHAHTVQEIVSASHGDPPWQRVPYGAVIAYHSVYYRDELVGSDEDEAQTTEVRAAS